MVIPLLFGLLNLLTYLLCFLYLYLTLVELFQILLPIRMLFQICPLLLRNCLPLQFFLYLLILVPESIFQLCLCLLHLTGHNHRFLLSIMFRHFLELIRDSFLILCLCMLLQRLLNMAHHCLLFCFRHNPIHIYYHLLLSLLHNFLPLLLLVSCILCSLLRCLQLLLLLRLLFLFWCLLLLPMLNLHEFLIRFRHYLLLQYPHLNFHIQNLMIHFDLHISS